MNFRRAVHGRRRGEGAGPRASPPLLRLGLLGFSLLLFAGSPVLAGQEYIGARRDFLTDHEIDVIREAQEPNLRVHRYLEFARLRIELIRLQLAEVKPGRSKIIHRSLKEYGRIMEAVDIVIDDALDRDFDLAPAIEALKEQQAKFLAALEKITGDPPEDHFRYQFVLEDAIEITRDGIELAESDLDRRKAALREADAREAAGREASMIPELKKEMDAIRQQEEKKKRKRPSLLRPEEKMDPRSKSK